MRKNLEEHGFVSTIQQKINHKDLQNCVFACFLSQEEPKKEEKEREVRGESEGFEQGGADKQFWSTVKAKTINEEVQLHALVDGKKIITTESTVRRDLQLEDAKGVDCLPNSTIFEQLTLIGSKTTAWNEFNSTMATAIICLATNQKFNFSKYIFESMVKSLDNVDEAVYKELDDSLVRAATTASSLEAGEAEDFVTLTFLDYLKLYFFENEHVAVNSTCYGLDDAAIGKPACLGRIQKNLLDRGSQLH
ncbi:hypothetical protein Tco_0958174 [Tanacetum coccineum]